MKPRDNEIDRTIIKEIAQHEPQGIGVRELLKKTGLSTNAIYPRLDRLRRVSIICQEPQFPLHLTEELLEKLKKGPIVLPCDPRSRKNRLTDRERKAILLILSIAAFGSPKVKRVYQTKSRSRSIVKLLKNKEFLYEGDGRSPGIGINDIVPKFFRNKSKTRSSYIKAHLLENKINTFNMDLFGYLELSRKEAEGYLGWLTKHYPLILVETKHNTQTRYVIKDEQLKGFIRTCVSLFCQDVYSILWCLYGLNDSRLRIQRKSMLKEYEMLPSSYSNTSNEARIPQIEKHIKTLKKSSFYRYRLMKHPTYDNTGKLPDLIKTFLEWMRGVWFGEERTSFLLGATTGIIIEDKTTEHLKYFAKGLFGDVDREVKGAIEDIKKCQIFDDKLEDINDKYNILEEKYPEVIHAIIDLLFPKFFMDIIRHWNIKNISSNQ